MLARLMPRTRLSNLWRKAGSNARANIANQTSCRVLNATVTSTSSIGFSSTLLLSARAADRFQDLLDEVRRIDSVGLRRIVKRQPMAQRRIRDPIDVFVGSIGAPVEQSPYLRP